ncbi:MAG: glutathione peroxidase [Alphaproteobacteria bacterium]|nr:glutathione peroxidase [Alphaproteobacteria bacterium]
MSVVLRFAAAIVVVALALLAPPRAATAGTAYDFGFTAIDGQAMPMAGFRGKAVLVVNTASFCGYTPQYQALETLWQRYRDRGLVVLGVPSNDFGQQEPGGAQEIKKFCEVNYSIDFPLTEKVAVKGAEAHPFYRWALAELGPAAAPRWNFHKYLVGPDGRLVGWFPTQAEPGSPDFIKAVEAALPR